MRILHVIDTMDPAAGGPTEVVRMLVDFAPVGTHSEIVTTDAPGTAFLADQRCPAHGVGPSPAKFYSPTLLPWLRANVGRFDAVLVHGLWEWAGIATRLACKGRVPYAVFPHGMLDPWFKRAHPGKHLKKYPYWLLAEYWNLRRARHVLFTTAQERDLARESFRPYNVCSAVVALGSEAPPEPTDAARDAFFAACPAVRGQRFLLYLGRIHPKKGADLLLDAFAAKAQTHADLHLVMAGPNPDNWGATLAAKLPAEFQSRVHWPGMLRGQAKQGAFACAEAFILPSHQENFGIAVVEALAAGLPVLTTHAVNIAAEIVADGAGFAESDTSAGIASLLERWLAMPAAERQHMAANARACFDRRYDMRRNTAAILAAIAAP